MATRGRGSRVKGASYERRISKILTDTFKIPFVRTPQSGGFAKHIDKTDDFRGDVINASKEDYFKLHVECKNQKVTNFNKWVEQAVSDCPADKYWSLIHHKNNSNVDYITMDLQDFLKIVDNSKIIKKVLD